jgi:two-component system phosphate regulon sensor histidine kinase PhoR
VKHIAEAHDGRVTVESEPGQGSRFTIELPFKK